MASDRDWEHGHDDALLELEQGLDQLRMLVNDIPQSHIIEMENGVATCFLRNFSNHDAYPHVVTSLLLRLVRSVRSGRALPSGRSINQLVEALGSVVIVPRTGAALTMASKRGSEAIVSAMGGSITIANRAGRDPLGRGQVQPVNDLMVVPYGVNVARKPPGTDTMSNIVVASSADTSPAQNGVNVSCTTPDTDTRSNIQNVALFSSMATSPTPMFNVRVGNFAFNNSTSLSIRDIMESVRPWMPGNSKSSVPPTNQRGTMSNNDDLSNQSKVTLTSNDELSNDQERNSGNDEEFDDESSEEVAALSAEDSRLFDAVRNTDVEAAAAAVQQAIRDGANVNTVDVINVYGVTTPVTTPLMMACGLGKDQIVRILLDAGADARWRNRYGESAITEACNYGHLSTVQLLINHDNGLLEFHSARETPLTVAIREQHSDIVRFLLSSSADPHHVDYYGLNALMYACHRDVDVEARDGWRRTALHNAARWGTSEIMLELIRQHNANMFAVDTYGLTSFDEACSSERTADVVDHLLDMYGNKLTHDHGRLALHKLLKVAKFSFAEDKEFHPPLNPLQIILPLGKLTLTHLSTLLHSVDPELIRKRDDTGKLPIHVACQTNAPVEVLALIVELDHATLHMADHAGALPVHLCCSGVVESSSVLYLVAQGGVGTLSARDHEGALPLHVLCGSTNPSLRTIPYLIHFFPGSVAMRTNAGQYPFMVAASDSSSASLSVVYELVRATPGLVVPG